MDYPPEGALPPPNLPPEKPALERALSWSPTPMIPRWVVSVMAGAVRSRAISGRPGFVIAAPYGTSDPHTGALAAELARRTGFALQVELPRTARTQWQELYIAVLAEFLAEAVALPASS